jgi:hypothetical protein
VKRGKVRRKVVVTVRFFADLPDDEVKADAAADVISEKVERQVARLHEVVDDSASVIDWNDYGEDEEEA